MSHSRPRMACVMLGLLAAGVTNLLSAQVAATRPGVTATTSGNFAQVTLQPTSTSTRFEKAHPILNPREFWNTVAVTYQGTSSATLVLYVARIEDRVVAQYKSRTCSMTSGQTFVPSERFYPGDGLFPPADQFVPASTLVPGPIIFPCDDLARCTTDFGSMARSSKSNPVVVVIAATYDPRLRTTVKSLPIFLQFARR